MDRSCPNKSYTRWGLLWRSDNRLDGKTRQFMSEKGSALHFRTRAEARAYRDKHYGYIRDRRDLQEEPHGWKIPQVVRIKISIERV